MNPIGNPNVTQLQQASVPVAKPVKAPAEKKTDEPAIKSYSPTVNEKPVDRQESAANGNAVQSDAQTREVKESELNQAISQINNFVQQIQRDLQFSVDEETGRTVIKVIDSESKEVVRQIPEEKLLEVARSIEETLEGNLLEVEA